MKTVYTSALLIAFALSGCNPPPDFDSVPKIEYVSVSKVQVTDEQTGGKSERVTVTVEFEDKEGDLGATAEERSDPAFISKYDDWGNYELVTIYQDANGELKEVVLSNNKPKWFPILRTDNGKGPLKGKLDLNFDAPYGNSTVMIDQKFKVRIRDRALHYSNQIETDFISLPGYR